MRGKNVVNSSDLLEQLNTIAIGLKTELKIVLKMIGRISPGEDLPEGLTPIKAPINGAFTKEVKRGK